MPATIQQGASGAPVREAQYLLARRHYLDAPEIDGVFGAHTTHAVREFQQSEGLAVDGVVGPATWSALLSGFAVPPTLQQGSSGPVVHRLQEVLNTAGRTSTRAPRRSWSTGSTVPTPGRWSPPSRAGAASRPTGSSACRRGPSPCTPPGRSWQARSACSTLKPTHRPHNGGRGHRPPRFVKTSMSPLAGWGWRSTCAAGLRGSPRDSARPLEDAV